MVFIDKNPRGGDLPKGSVFDWLKINHTISVGQEFREGLAGCFWFRVSFEAAEMLAWATVV